MHVRVLLAAIKYRGDYPIPAAPATDRVRHELSRAAPGVVDGYVEIRGRRFSVPDVLCGHEVRVRIGLDGHITVFDKQDRRVAEHSLEAGGSGWVTVPGHHKRLWDDTLRVERRDLAVYEEVA